VVKVPGCCEYGNEPSRCVKWRKVLDYLRTSQLLRNESAPPIYFIILYYCVYVTFTAVSNVWNVILGRKIVTFCISLIYNSRRNFTFLEDKMSHVISKTYTSCR
jgi:hypothetical protein